MYNRAMKKACAYYIPAAQYVRMSDEAQEYSIDNQKAAIREYASSHGFEVVKTYADFAKSGVVAKNRTGLRQLLTDVVSGKTDYKAILVYDVSRWGRFPNSDEAAHYEFLCHSSGIPLHYCAESFTNDGTPSSSLLKALKRSMAAEFSRELGEKVFRGKARIVRMGFWVGGPAGFGFRRMMVSGKGEPKQMLNPGEYKNLTTDRVVLVPGPAEELKIVHAMFCLASSGYGPTVIARELNRKGLTHCGRPWTHQVVHDILHNPKYMGCNIWNRSTQRLRTAKKWISPELWIEKQNAFPAIVSSDLFARAQSNLPVPKKWTREEIVTKMARLLKRKGRISEDIIKTVRGMPSPATIYYHFGSYRQLYKELNYTQASEDRFKGKQFERSLRFRRKLVRKIKELFPEHVSITHLPRRSRSILQVDRCFMVSILLCRSKCKYGKSYWVIEPNVSERAFITLLVLLNNRHDGALSYLLLPRMTSFKRIGKYDSWIRRGVRLRTLSDFYQIAKKLWAGRSDQSTLAKYIAEL